MHESSTSHGISRETYSVAAVVITYFPDSKFGERLEAIAEECDHIIIVDNGATVSESMIPAPVLKSIEVLNQPANIGLAGGLNLGVNRAIALGFRWVITFDQDTTPQTGLASALLNSILSHGSSSPAALVGSRIEEEKVAQPARRWVRQSSVHRWLYSRVCCEGKDLSGISVVITSGTLMDVAAYRQIGLFDDDLFIDYIDHDYCLRARAKGYEVLVSAQAVVKHNLGAKTARKFVGIPVFPTHHSPLRLRYMARNRWRLARRHAGRFPHWFLYDSVYWMFNILRVLAFETEKTAKLAAIVTGTLDAMHGRYGRIGKSAL